MISRSSYRPTARTLWYTDDKFIVHSVLSTVTQLTVQRPVSYLRHGGYVIVLFVCLSVCLPVSNFAKKTSERICMRFSGKFGNGSMNEQTIKFWWRSGSRIRIRDPDRGTGKTCLGGVVGNYHTDTENLFFPQNMKQSPLYPMLVILTVLVVRFVGLSSTSFPSPPDEDSPRADCRFSSPAVVNRPRGRVALSLLGAAPLVDCRPDMALRLRPKPRGRVCDRSAASPRRAAAYLAVVFRRYTLHRHAHTRPQPSTVNTVLNQLRLDIFSQ